MINKPTLALVAALLAGTASSAFASSMDNDANTGLWSYLYYGPIADLQQQGLPVSSNAANYAKQHGTARSASKRGNVYLLEDTRGVHAPAQLTPDRNGSDFQSNSHMW